MTLYMLYLKGEMVNIWVNTKADKVCTDGCPYKQQFMILKTKNLKSRKN